MKDHGVPWMSLSTSLSFFGSLFLAFVIRCFASMAIGSMLKLVVCCNHIAGVVVRWVSPYMSLDSSLHMVLIRHICNFGLVDDG